MDKIFFDRQDAKGAKSSYSISPADEYFLIL